MPFSHCLNCGAAKTPPYIEFYCDDCEKIRMTARDNALKNNLNPSDEARRALATRAITPQMNRMDPRTPYTKRDFTQNIIDSFREGA